MSRALLSNPELRTYVLGVLHHLGAPPQIREDLAQITLYKAFRAIDTYDARRALFTTWIHQITKRVWMDHCRAQATECKHIVFVEEFEEGGVATHHALDLIENQFYAEGLRTIQTHLNGVTGTAEQNYITLGLQALNLRVLGYSDGEIAELLEVPLGTAKSALRRFRERALRILRENGFEELLPAEHRLAGSP